MSDEVASVFTCEQCHRTFAWKPQLAGKRVACKCGGRINVPTMPPVPAPASRPSTTPTSPKISAPRQVEPPPIPVVEVAAPDAEPSWEDLDNLPEPTQLTPSSYMPAYTPVPTQSYMPPQANTGRPGKLIAVGIISIIIGFISLGASFLTSVIWKRAYDGSVPKPVVNTSLGSPLPAASFPPYTGTTMRLTGWPQDVRSQIEAATPFTGAYATQRREMLDRLLSEDGQHVMPNGAADTLKPTAPSGNVAASDTPDRSVRFIAPHGTVEVNSKWARYSPQGQVVEFFDRNIAAMNHRTLLSATMIDQDLQQLRNSLPGVTPMQLAFVAEQLTKHNFNANFNGNADQAAQKALERASMDTDKALTLRIEGEEFLVLPDGRGMLRFQAPFGIEAATGRPMFAPPKVFQPFLPGDPNLMHWLYYYCLFVMVVALYLMAAGIVTLVRPSMWAVLHLPYAGVKLLLIITEIGLSLAFFSSISSGSSGSTTNFDTSTGTQGLITTTIIQVIYPLVLLAMHFSNPGLGRETSLPRMKNY